MVGEVTVAFKSGVKLLEVEPEADEVAALLVFVVVCASVVSLVVVGTLAVEWVWKDDEVSSELVALAAGVCALLSVPMLDVILVLEATLLEMVGEFTSVVLIEIEVLVVTGSAVLVKFVYIIVVVSVFTLLEVDVKLLLEVSIVENKVVASVVVVVFG